MHPLMAFSALLLKTCQKKKKFGGRFETRNLR